MTLKPQRSNIHKTPVQKIIIKNNSEDKTFKAFHKMVMQLITINSKPTVC